MPIISWPILLRNISIIVHSWKDEWYICCLTEAEEFYTTLSASSCCVNNMKYHLRLREKHTLPSSRTFQSWTWRSKFKSDLAKMCSHSKKLSRSWTALIEIVSVPDDAEHSQRLTWFWLLAVVFIFILTELTDDVGLTHYKYSPKSLFHISSMWEIIEKNPPTAWG